MNASVLLIDDDRVFTQTLGSALRRRGYDVTAINDEMDIDAAASARDYDHILLDLMLGDVSTIGRISRLCAAQPGARLIMLTGYASIPATVQAMRSDAVNLLAKPIGVREVVAAMEDDSDQPEEMIPDPGPMGLKRVEWEYIQRVLAEHRGNVSAAARSLGMHRRTLQRKLEKRAPR
jgi:two-component system, response regulator RegA